MIFRSHASVDGCWRLLLLALFAGRLDGIRTMKVATSDDVPAEMAKRHLICLYTRDFSDTAELRRTRQHLRAVGFMGKLTYKADYQTAMDIYDKNPWKIKASIMTE